MATPMARDAQTSLQLFQLRGKVFVLLQEQRNASFWPRPPTNAWLYAGVVTSSAKVHLVRMLGLATEAISIRGLPSQDRASDLPNSRAVSSQPVPC